MLNAATAVRPIVSSLGRFKRSGAVCSQPAVRSHSTSRRLVVQTYASSRKSEGDSAHLVKSSTTPVQVRVPQPGTTTPVQVQVEQRAFQDYNQQELCELCDVCHHLTVDFLATVDDVE